MKLTPSNLSTITFDTCMSNSDGEPIKGTGRQHILLFNKTQISADEVNELIQNDSWEFDKRVIELAPGQLQFLADK